MGAAKGNQNALANKGGTGRPSKLTLYSCEYWERRIGEFIDTCKNVEGRMMGQEDDKVIARPMMYYLPTWGGLALALEIPRDTMDDWSRHDSPQGLVFATYGKLITEMQKNLLLAGGLSGVFPATFTKFLLSANHGMHEKTEKTVNVQHSLVDAIREADKLEEEEKVIEGEVVPAT